MRDFRLIDLEFNQTILVLLFNQQLVQTQQVNNFKNIPKELRKDVLKIVVSIKNLRWNQGVLMPEVPLVLREI